MIRSTFKRDVHRVGAKLELACDEDGNPRLLNMTAADGYVWRATGEAVETRQVCHVFELPEIVDAIDDEVLSRGVVKPIWARYGKGAKR